MTPNARRSLGILIVMGLGAICQIAFARSLRVFGVQPDILMTVMLLCSLYCDVGAAAGIGFSAGLIQAAWTEPTGGGFGSLIVSRTLVCSIIGWLEDQMFRDHIVMAFLITAVGTLLTEGFFALFDPHFRILTWLRGVGFEAIYNALLALLLYYPVRLLAGADQENDFRPRI